MSIHSASRGNLRSIPCCVYVAKGNTISILPVSPDTWLLPKTLTILYNYVGLVYKTASPMDCLIIKKRKEKERLNGHTADGRSSCLPRHCLTEEAFTPVQMLVPGWHWLKPQRLNHVKIQNQLSKYLSEGLLPSKVLKCSCDNRSDCLLRAHWWEQENQRSREWWVLFPFGFAPGHLFSLLLVRISGAQVSIVCLHWNQTSFQLTAI